MADDDGFNPEIFGDGGSELDTGDGPCNSSIAASGSTASLLFVGLVAIARRRRARGLGGDHQTHDAPMGPGVR